MEVRSEGTPSGADVVVVPVAEGKDPPAGADARVRELIASGEASAGFAETTLIHADGTRLAIAGLGTRTDSDAIRTAVAGAARETRRVGGTIAYLVDPALPLSADEQARAAVDGLVLGTYDPGRWRTRDLEHAKSFERLVLVGADDGATHAAERQARIAAWANRARDLSNAPPNELTPEQLADQAAEYAKATGVTAEAHGRKQIEEL